MSSRPGAQPDDDEAEAYIRARIERLPPPLRDAAHGLRRPGARWLRRAIGVLLMLCGVLWFLPLLGFWMLPLGLFLIAEDLPASKRRLARLLMRVEAWWKERRGGR